MVTQLKPAPHWTELLGQALGQGVQGGFEGYQKGAQQQQVGNTLEQLGLDRGLASLPKEFLQPILKNALRANTWPETAQNLLSILPFVAPAQRPGMKGTLGGQQAQQQTMNINGQEVPVGAFSKGTQEALQMNQAEQEQQYNTTGRNVGSFLGSYLTPTALLQAAKVHPLARLLLQGGTAIDLGLQGSNWLARKTGLASEGQNILPTYQELQNPTLPPQVEEHIKRQAGGDQAFEQYLRKNATQNPFQALTTLGQQIEGIQSGAEALGVPITPVTEDQRKAAALGEMAAFASDPSQWNTPLEAAKGVAKAFTAATGIKIGGKAIEQLTGSETAGKIGEGILLGMYGMFPGFFGGMAQKRLDAVNKAIGQADEAGIMINGRSAGFQNQYQQIEKAVKRGLQKGTEARNWMENELSEASPFFNGYEELTASQLNSTTLQNMKKYSQVPAQAEKYHQQLINLNREVLGKTLNTVSSGADKAITEAYNLLHTGHNVADDIQNILTVSSPRKSALAAGALFGGGYRALIAGAASASGLSYLKNYFGNPIVRSEMTKLARASATNNVAGMERSLNKLDRHMQLSLQKLPTKKREEVERVLKQYAAKK
jgi:hypothetical protein